MHLSRSQIIWPQSICPGGPCISLNYQYDDALRIFQDNKPKLLDYLYNTEEPKRVFAYIPLALPNSDTYVVQVQQAEKKRNAIWIYQNYSGIFSVHWCQIPYGKVSLVFEIGNYGSAADLDLFQNNEGVSTEKNILMDYLGESSRVPSRPRHHHQPLSVCAYSCFAAGIHHVIALYNLEDQPYVV